MKPINRTAATNRANNPLKTNWVVPKFPPDISQKKYCQNKLKLHQQLKYATMKDRCF